MVMMKVNRPWLSGFTLIELLVVMAIIGTLLTLVTPRYFKNVDRAKEAVLKQDLAAVRDALDKYHSDTGKYPAELEDLVSSRYIRKVPVDPMTSSADTWILDASPDPKIGGIFDIHSGSPDQASDGTAYSLW
jgi:general secretion pathway protein G